jgi:hypothetical protein
LACSAFNPFQEKKQDYAVFYGRLCGLWKMQEKRLMRDLLYRNHLSDQAIREKHGNSRF